MLWTTTLGSALAALEAVSTIPQTARTVRRRDLAGLSVTTLLAWTASWAMWIVYSLSIEAYPQAAGELVGLGCETALLVAVLVAAHRAGNRPGTVLARSSWILAGVPVLVVVLIVGGPFALAVGLTLYDLLGVLPQVRNTVIAPSLSGLSLTTWAVQAVVGLGWIVYAVGIGHPEAAGSTFVMLPVTVLVCARIRTDRRRAATATADLTPAPPDPEPSAPN